MQIPRFHIEKPANWRDFIHRFLLNKYVLVLLIFTFVFLLSGEQSLISFAKRGRRIRQTQAQIEQTQQQINECRREIRTMGNTDSLERFAREYYYMHADGEDVYLIGKQPSLRVQ
ncbi:MAG: septum formation initiator family protein [Paludibacteraceae bacterium]|nr:septum formation initiator family protein [Paludibacteraceae bacterium]